MERKIKFAPEEFYHLYSRGTDKKKVFLDRYDYDRFVKLLYLANCQNSVNLRETPPNVFTFRKDETLVHIGAYCLMPNHFHLLVKEHTDGGISKFMSKLLTSHSTFFNKKYKRAGTLFESRFKAKHLDTDEYLKYIFAYIHLNPVKLIDPRWKDDGIKNAKKAKDYLGSYAHSSYPDYTNETDSTRKEAKILTKSAFPGYFDNIGDFSSMIDNWLNFRELDL